MKTEMLAKIEEACGESTMDDFWNETLTNLQTDPKYFYTLNNTTITVYCIEDDTNDRYSMKGYGGRPFRVTLNNKAPIITHNLWWIGELPSKWLQFLPEDKLAKLEDITYEEKV